MVYLDNNATTRPSPAVIQRMTAVMQDDYANPSSTHMAGQRAAWRVEEARASVARLIGARPSEIVFTSSATESNHWAVIEGFRAASRRPAVLISATEHSSVWGAAVASGAEVRVLGVDQSGRYDLAKMPGLLTSDVALVSIQLANNETGVLPGAEPVIEACRERGIAVHVDAVQAAGKVPLSVESLGCDLLSLSAHKLHGPKGVGALYIRRGFPIPPWLAGGTQESGRRAGTLAADAIAGFGVAADEAMASLPGNADVAARRDHLESGLLAAWPGAVSIGKTAPRLANTCMVAFPPLQADALVVLLSEMGIYVSAGAACSSGGHDPSRVVLAMGYPDAVARSAVRFSLSRYTTDAEIAEVLACTHTALSRLKSV